MNNRYSGFDFVKKYINKNGAKYKFKGSSVKDFQKWRKAVIPRLKKDLGFDNFSKVKLCSRNIDKKEFKNYILEKISISTMNNLDMPFYVMTPKKGNGIPVIALHGHSCGGKEGMIPSEENEESPLYSYAVDLMEKGYTVYIPDLLGAGERELGIYKYKEKSDCNELNFALISLGMSLQGVIVFELMRLVDYIEKKSSVDKVGVVGFSGGAYSALWLGIIDERIKYVVSSGYFHSFKDTLLFTNRCGCNFVPRLWNRVDMSDMASLLAPRPFYVEIGADDSLNGERGLIGVEEQIEKAQAVYSLYNKKIGYCVCKGGHKWHGSCYDWINKIVNN